MNLFSTPPLQAPIEKFCTEVLFIFLGRTRGSPRQQKFCPSPATKHRPRFLTRVCPPQLSFVPKDFKNFTSFFLNFNYFSAQNCIRKLYFCLKYQNLLYFCCRGHFWPQLTIFPSPPSSDSDPNTSSPPPHLTPSLTGTENRLRKQVPPPKMLWKKACVTFNLTLHVETNTSHTYMYTTGLTITEGTEGQWLSVPLPMALVP